jgi:hypothetical protein
LSLKMVNLCNPASADGGSISKALRSSWAYDSLACRACAERVGRGGFMLDLEKGAPLREGCRLAVCSNISTSFSLRSRFLMRFSLVSF